MHLWITKIIFVVIITYGQLLKASEQTRSLPPIDLNIIYDLITPAHKNSVNYAKLLNRVDIKDLKEELRNWENNAEKHLSKIKEYNSQLTTQEEALKDVLSNLLAMKIRRQKTSFNIAATKEIKRTQKSTLYALYALCGTFGSLYCAYALYQNDNTYIARCCYLVGGLSALMSFRYLYQAMHFSQRAEIIKERGINKISKLF